MKIIVGLGNPGSKYQGTRHNIGFEVIDYLAGAPGIGPARSKFQASIAETKIGDEPLLLVKPETFMNLSGRAVRQILDFYKLTTNDFLVISDDFNLPLGKLRVRGKGSHGGQNGLRNIQETLGSDEYPRMRIGVGSPSTDDPADFVLSKFKPGEKATVEDAVAKAAQLALVWVRSGLDACMNQANGPEPGQQKPKKPKPEKAKEPKQAIDAKETESSGPA